MNPYFLKISVNKFLINVNFLWIRNVSRETFANRGNGDKLVYRHFRGAASCDCFPIALHSGAIANAHRASEVKIRLRNFISEPQDVAIASLLFCFLLQSPTRSNISELPDVIPADAEIARSVKKLTPAPFDCALRQAQCTTQGRLGRGDILLNHSP